MANGTPGNPPEDEILLAEATADRSAARACMLRLNGWTNNVQENGNENFTKEFVFRDFNQAWEFMCLVTVRLRTMNHHPDWRHVRNKVTVTLPSPEVAGLSTKDSSLASFMEDIAGEMSH
jgi:4a-hydroxytetrahydrobiopterin dehydratase